MTWHFLKKMNTDVKPNHSMDGLMIDHVYPQSTKDTSITWYHLTAKEAEKQHPAGFPAGREHSSPVMGNLF